MYWYSLQRICGLASLHICRLWIMYVWYINFIIFIITFCVSYIVAIIHYNITVINFVCISSVRNNNKISSILLLCTVIAFGYIAPIYYCYRWYYFYRYNLNTFTICIIFIVVTAWWTSRCASVTLLCTLWTLHCICSLQNKWNRWVWPLLL